MARLKNGGLHPFTFPPWKVQHKMLRKKAEPRTPHFLSLNQDIVAWSQEEKSGV